MEGGLFSVLIDCFFEGLQRGTIANAVARLYPLWKRVNDWLGLNTDVFRLGISTGQGEASIQVTAFLEEVRGRSFALAQWFFDGNQEGYLPYMQVRGKESGRLEVIKFSGFGSGSRKGGGKAVVCFMLGKVGSGRGRVSVVVKDLKRSGFFVGGKGGVRRELG